MIYALVQLHVEEFKRFWEGFTTRGLPLRQTHGSQSAQVFQHADAPNRVTILFQWTSEDDLKAFFESPQVQDSQRRGGMIGQPAITLLQLAGALPA